MNIQSMLEKDSPRPKSTAGAYEWWYFDAISDDGKMQIVVIFYEGNPFSRRYVNRLDERGLARAEDFPAISIAIYQQGKTVYYSFTEVEKEAAFFGKDRPAVQIENHRMSGRAAKPDVIYKLNLSERLPSGYQLDANLRFNGPVLSRSEAQKIDREEQNHYWSAILPRANVTGNIHCKTDQKTILSVDFTGTGYHDHNWGCEPLKNHFEDWYWGRFHFEGGTFIYYIMNDTGPTACAWLLSCDGTEFLHSFGEVDLQDKDSSLFGLQTARRIVFRSKPASVMIQQHQLLDNGPFYQRYSSEAFLNIPARDLIQQSPGITEYLNPPRIYNRLFWPLVNMRIRYKKESPHWVQRFQRLYQWTW